MAEDANPVGGAAGPEKLGTRRLFYLYVGFAALCLALLRPALDGPPVSDDLAYIIYNPYIFELSAENLGAILDPWGPPTALTVNYAPLHLLMHAVEVQIFGKDLFAWHVVNVLVHAANAVLLVMLLHSQLSLRFALLGGALFAVHPANVEAVAWLFQLKTDVALALSLCALLALRGRPKASALLFGLALLTKASAAFALPMAAALCWAQGFDRRSVATLAAWTVLLALYCVPQFAAFEYSTGVEVAAYRDPWVHGMTIAAIGMRYLVMAATGIGLSAFQELPPVTSPLDPWFLASLPVGAALAWRTFGMLRQRREEAAWWIGAAAAYFPISQVFPFIYPMGDRYLYFILPGLIGALMLLGRDAAARIGAGGGRGPGSEAIARVVLGAGLVLVITFALQSRDRAVLWLSEERLYQDAALHYPDGSHAHFLHAVEALRMGDKRLALSALRTSVERGHDRVRDLAKDPVLEPLRDQPGFGELMREIAARRIATGRNRGYESQTWLHGMAEAHRVLGEFDEAEALLERAIAAEGPLGEARLRRELDEVRKLARPPDGE